MDVNKVDWEGSSKHTYDLDKLRPGDIILSTSPGRNSRVIRRFTKSPFSHAMLYADNKIVHADINGVFTTNPQRRLFPAGTSLVLRLQSEDLEIGASACQYALNLTGSRYSVPEAMLSYVLRKTARRSIGDVQFCSRLVAQSYAHVGVNLVDNPDFCFPGEFARANLLKPVVGATRLATPGEIELGKKPDMVVLHREHTYAWLRPLCDLVEEDGFERPASIKLAFEFLIAHPKYDRQATDLLTRSNYLDDYKLDEVANHYRYDRDALEMLLLSRPAEASHILEVEYKVAADVLESAKSQYHQFSQVRMNFFKLIADMHKNRVEQMRGVLENLADLATKYNHVVVSHKCASELRKITQL